MEGYQIIERQQCAVIAERKARQLTYTMRKCRKNGDEEGARKASIGRTIATVIANEIRASYR